jgi:nitrate reductase assembly molybdenum cofactor insertion protein NarJ
MRQTDCRHCGTWLAEAALLSDGFNWGLVTNLEADLLMRPETNYLAPLIRYLTMVRDLPEARFANPFRDAFQSMTTAELQDSYRQAFECKPGCALRVRWERWPCAQYCDQIVARMKSTSRASQTTVIPADMTADHLVIVLRILARSCAALGEDIAALTLPTVSRIISNMESTSPFRLLMQAVEETLTPR